MSKDDPNFTAPSWPYIGAGTSANVTFSGPGTYYFRVHAKKSGAITTPWVTTSGTNVPEIVSPVTWIFANTSATTTTFPVAWAASSTFGVTYELQMSKDDPDFTVPSWPYIGTGTSTSVTFSGPGTYYFRVHAKKSGSITTAWVTTSGTSVPDIVLPVSWIFAKASATTATLPVAWGASSTSGVTYELQMSKGDPSFTTPSLPYSGTGTSANVTFSGPGTYYFRVRAMNANATTTDWIVTSGTVVDY
jgi:hypothetical protein